VKKDMAEAFLEAERKMYDRINMKGFAVDRDVLKAWSGGG